VRRFGSERVGFAEDALLVFTKVDPPFGRRLSAAVYGAYGYEQAKTCESLAQFYPYHHVVSRWYSPNTALVSFPRFLWLEHNKIANLMFNSNQGLMLTVG
jgi:hypothetical protein